MFGKMKKRQARVEITFKHGQDSPVIIPKEIIDIPLGQEFQQDIGSDKLWEGDTLIREYDWRAGYTKVYEYFYR